MATGLLAMNHGRGAYRTLKEHARHGPYGPYLLVICAGPLNWDIKGNLASTASQKEI